MKNKLPLSVVIITKNEANNIAESITSAQFAQEILVIDAFSTDATAEIAQSHGAKVLCNKWHGYGTQKNFGAQHAAHNWILFLDADERVSPELQRILPDVITRAEYSVYWITLEDIFLGKRMKHLVGHNPRLIQKIQAHWNTAHVHEQMLYADTNIPAQYKDGMSGEIQESIIHQSYTSISAYLKKMHRYTSLDAEEMHKTSTHRSGRAVTKNPLLPIYLAFRQFGKLLLYRKGILDGWQGVVWCALSAYYELEMGNKYLALRHPELDSGSRTFDNVDSGSSPE